MKLMRATVDDVIVGFQLDTIIEAIPMVRPLPLPAPAPEFVEGLVNLRGTAIPMISLRSRFGRGLAEARSSDHLLIVRTGWRSLAIHVDRVADVVDLPDEDVRASGAIQPGLRWISGIIPDEEDGLIFVQDIEAYLSDEERSSIDQAMERA